MTTPAFLHQATLYGSDEEFLAMAVPFVTDGLAEGEPVMVTTTSANLDLLADALGPLGTEVDCAESAYFGRRTAQRATGFIRYWRRKAAGPSPRVRILAEPVWSGRSPREVTSWKRMESALNVALADTGVWMICPYDTRVVAPGIAADARRTHPSLTSDGRTIEPSPDYADPARFIAHCDSTPLDEPPSGAATLTTADLPSLRRFVTERARAHGLTAERGTLLAVAAYEAAVHLRGRVDPMPDAPTTARVWDRMGALVCDLRQPGAHVSDPVAGFRPPDRAAAPGDGLWLTRQICDHVDIRTEGASATIRLQVPSSRVEDVLQKTLL
jgi:hypothetical protein